MDNSVPQQQQQPQGPDMEDIAFTAKLNNVRPLVNMLRAVNINTRGQCTINASGVVFSSEESRCMVAHAYMKKSQFSQFGFNPIPNQNQKDDQAQQEDDENEEDDMVFGLHIETLIECLGLFLGPSNSNAPSSRAQASSFIGADASGAGGSTMPGYANLSLYKGATTVKLAYDGPGSDFELM
ncbi:checkpoint clamp complex protein Rad1 [Mycoemilia scoparia]|uniref:Checkpoint clamp complex protein Rad1 n=1 Tax=Mycoemilia scoparia TaxID=417184 RepID=A0A9W8A325_9FUNG|nr:checkpoint clamp complex protein Rad1 [Mycoemilia scoparia]